MKRIISWIIRHIPRRHLQKIAGFGSWMLGKFYAGNQVFCPVCEKSFRKFLPYGRLQARANALCPNCLSLERHRLIWLYLQRKTRFFQEPMDVLHIAPEACFINRFEKIHGDRYVTADIESPLAKIKMDIHKIPFADNTFDIVLCNHVLEHVKDDIQAMREINRVLKQDGYAILQVPFFHPIPQETEEDPAITNPADRERLYGQDDHVRKYGYDYTQRISSSGLFAKEEKFVTELSDEDTFRFGLMPTEIIYTGIKK